MQMVMNVNKAFEYTEPGIKLSMSADIRPDRSRFQMHTHQNIEVYCFLKGRGVFHIEGSEYPLESGDVLIMQPAESHYIDIDCSLPYERIVLNFSPDYLTVLDPVGYLLLPFTQRPGGKLNIYKSSEFPGGSLSLWQAMMSPIGDPHVNLLSGLLPLLNQICLLWQQRREDPQPDTPAYRIIRHVNAHLEEPLSLDELSTRFYLSKSQLCRLFKKATGTTIWHYITVKRLAKAQELIAGGAHPTHIYTRCGFNDYSTFYRAYVQYFGCCPRDDRQDIPISDRFEIT